MSENSIVDEEPSYQPFQCWSHLRRLISSLHHIEIRMDSDDVIIQSDNHTQSIAWVGPSGNHKLFQLPLIVIYWRKYHQNGKCGFHVWQQWKVVVFVENSSHASNRCRGNSDNLRTSGHLPYIIHNVNTKYHWPGLHTWTTSNWTRLVDARLIVYLEPSHWLNQCWRIVIWIAGQLCV